MDRLYRVLVNAFALKSEIKCKPEKILTRRRPVSVSIRTVPNTPGPLFGSNPTVLSLDLVKCLVHAYQNLNPEWTRTGPIKQPTLILYGKADKLESSEAYQKLLSSGYPASIKVIGFAGAYKKFDELGPDREKYHPSVGYFSKGFQQKALDVSVSEVRDFLEENLK